MKKIIYCMGAAAMLLAVSCAKEQAPVTEPVDNLVQKTFTATTDMATKTSLHTDGKSVNWSDRDKISVFAINEGTVASHTAFAAENIDGTTADFTGATDAEATDFVALYPYNSAASVTVAEGVTTVKTTIPYTQKAVRGGFDTNLNLMLASTTKEAGHFSFKNLCSLIKITIPEASEGDDLTKITALSMNFREPVVGTFTYNTDTEVAEKSGDNGGKTVSIVSEDGTPLDAGNYYFVISSHAAASYNGGKQGIIWISATLTDGNVKTVQNKDMQLELLANKIYNVGEVSLAKAKPDLTVKNAPVGPFPMGVTQYQLEWIFNDENTDDSKVTFSARNTDVATVDASGLVSFTGKPGPAHIHLNYKGYVYPIVFNVEAGWYRDDLANWYTPTGGATITPESEGQGYVTVNMASTNATTARADIQRANGVYLNREYPILCFKLDNLKLSTFTTKGNIALLAEKGYIHNSGNTTTMLSGKLNNADNRWMYQGTFGDGDLMLLVYDLAQQNVGNKDYGYGMKVPEDMTIYFPNFKMNYADMQPWEQGVSEATYRYYGFNTFKTLEEAKAFYGIEITKR